MKKHAAGPFLAFYVVLLKDQKQRKVTYTEPTKIGYVRAGGFKPTELILNVCEDASKNRVLDQSGKQISEGIAGTRVLYARPIGGTWKLWNGDDGDAVDSCSSS